MNQKLATVFPELLWAGTDHSLELARGIFADLMAGAFDRAQATPDEEEIPYNFELQGNVGVVRVRGPLLNVDSPWARYRGATTYPDIRRALVHGATNPGVEVLLMDIDSGGGAVSGMSDTADLIAQIDKSIKPVYSSTDGAMASAAYWLGSSGRKVWTSKTSIMGSIGVITTHMEYSKALREAGVGVKVMRAGEFKALASAVEPLSKVAEEQIQAQLDSAYGVFIGHVADRRGTSVEAADASMGQGREFFGEAAVKAGLADGVASFDKVMSLVTAIAIDRIEKKANNAGNFQRGPHMNKLALTEQHIAALAGGAPAAAAGTAAAGAATTPATTPAVTTPATAPAAEVTTPAAAATTPAAAAAPAVPEPTAAAVLTYLQGQLAAAMQEAATSKVALDAAKGQIDALQVTQKGLIKIAADSVSHMKVALGQARVDLSGMSAETLLAEHSATAKVFADTFKVGGVAALGAVPEAAKDEIDPGFAARLAANRSHTAT